MNRTEMAPAMNTLMHSICCWWSLWLQHCYGLERSCCGRQEQERQKHDPGIAGRTGEESTDGRLCRRKLSIFFDRQRNAVPDSLRPGPVRLRESYSEYMAGYAVQPYELGQAVKSAMAILQEREPAPGTVLLICIPHEAGENSKGRRHIGNKAARTT